MASLLLTKPLLSAILHSQRKHSGGFLIQLPQVSEVQSLGILLVVLVAIGEQLRIQMASLSVIRYWPHSSSSSHSYPNDNPSATTAVTSPPKLHHTIYAGPDTREAIGDGSGRRRGVGQICGAAGIELWRSSVNLRRGFVMKLRVKLRDAETIC